MPLYDYKCPLCGLVTEVIMSHTDTPPECCGGVMTRQFSGEVTIKSGYPLWVDRMEDIGKAQNDRGERRRLVHPKDVGAT